MLLSLFILFLCVSFFCTLFFLAFSLLQSQAYASSICAHLFTKKRSTWEELCSTYNEIRVKRDKVSERENEKLHTSLETEGGFKGRGKLDEGIKGNEIKLKD
jgi:hypothetical protein